MHAPKGTKKKQISIHAPPRGATRRPRRAAAARRHFNSRPSARGDGDERRPGHGGFISIHAPPRGATSPDTTTGRNNHISIHAPPRGATRDAPRRVSAGSAFQFTPLREGRPRTAALHAAIAALFQFTPLREGRRDERQKPRHGKHFNSRPSARGDQNHMAGLAERADFNSRPSARGD